MPDRHLWTRHSTKTVTFTGAVGAGESDAPSTVLVFTITGRVYLHEIVAHCTTTVVSAGGGTIALGVTADTDAFCGAITASDLAAGDWWSASTTLTPAGAATYGAQTTSGTTTSSRDKGVSTDILITIGVADITAGVIVFDAIYTPLTDGARLS